MTVAVEDASGNIETTDNTTTVGLAIGTNPGGGTLTGGSAVTVASGIATFSGLSINKAGTGYTLTASSTPTYTPATSSAFNITPGTATQLAFVQGPTNTAAGATMTPAVTVAVEDANGNIETADNATKVEPGHRDQPRQRDAQRRHGRHGGRRASPPSPGLSINKPGTGYTLTASSTPTYTRGHLVGLQHHPGCGHQAGLRPGPDQHRRRFGHHAGGDGGGRGRERQRRDR